MSVHSKLGELGTAIHELITTFLNSEKVDKSLDKATKAVKEKTKELANGKY